MREQVIDFLKGNPNSNKAAITAGTGIKGLPLFNLLKRLLTIGQLISVGEGNNATYSLNDSYTEEQVPEEQTDATATDGPIEPVVGNGKKEDKPKKTADETTPVASTTRDNSKYKFNGEEYGKGPLVRAVLAKYVEDHPDTTFKQLKEVFPDTLMKRFGVFASETEAKKLSGTKPRYFLKPEQMIKIKGQKEPIAICNQWTAALIEPFIKVAKELGYKIK